MAETMQIQRPTYKHNERPVENRSFLQRLQWIHIIPLATTPVLSLYGMLTTTVDPRTVIWGLIYYSIVALGVTAGYHRLWSHKSYSAAYPLQVFLALAGSAAMQGSIFWWARDHRVHHRYTDTFRDPYNAMDGFWHCHVGWALMKKDRRTFGYVDTSDLKTDSLVRWQHKYYPLLLLIFTMLFPMSVAGFGWGDWRGGFFYASILRIVLIHHATLCINSLAHTIGRKTYDDVQTARDSWITALVIMGEGYHNYHHQFPNDYRSAIRYYQYDPTKWFIRCMSFIGLASDLKVFPANEVEKGYIQMRMKELEARNSKLTFGTPVNKLPVYTEQEFLDQAKNYKKQWMVIEGFVYDVKPFINDHPGGAALILSGIGKDMTEAFNGGIYMHHNSARNLMNTSLRIGKLIPTT